MHALTGTSLFDFGLSRCAPSDLDSMPTIKGRERGWCCSPEQKLPRRRLTGVGRSGVPGLVLGCGLVQKNECGMRNPLGSYAGSGKDLGRSRDGGGGCARRSIAGVRSRGCWGATDYDF